MSRNLVQVTGDGDIVAGPVWVHSLTFTGTDAGGNLAEIKDGAAGAVRLSLRAVIGTSVTWRSGDPKGVLFSNAVNWGHAGAGASLAVEYS